METALRGPTVHPGNGWQVASVRTKAGQSARGFIRNESSADLQLQSFDGRLHLLSKRDVTGIDRDTKSAMPPWTGSPQGLRDLIAFLMKDCCAGHPEICAPALADAQCRPATAKKKARA